MIPSLAIGALFAAACTDPSEPVDVRGIWNAQSIGGYDIPGTVVYQDDSLATEYVRWVLYDGGPCTLTQRVDDLTRTYDECTYTVNDPERTLAIVFMDEEWTGRFDGDRMTLTDPQDVEWLLRAQ